ncbi:S8 family peptidase [Chryseobacterium sp.]|uniref:S8 family peptidase n=1 Tax=Chryseobacterium sp. TaxID=1871047 RepID=UPI0011C88B76|nr:S8 family peptidase [Chryseobacterium sp.]TXF77790.1 S8 family peptidase [Chryseobacterium sp.]
MAKKINYLLGKGERLTEQIKYVSSGGPKEFPYTFTESKNRLIPMLNEAVVKMNELPAEACPNDYAVAMITLNPEFIAKSYFPTDLLRSIGLESIGSRTKQIVPSKKSKGRKPEKAGTTELFVCGTRGSFNKWLNEFPNWKEGNNALDQIVEIEEISFPEAKAKIKGNLSKEGKTVFEVVLHMNESLAEAVHLRNFKNYLLALGVDVNFDRRFYAGGLCFLQVTASPDMAENISRFTLIRTIRKMPELRLLKPIIRSVVKKDVKIEIPDIMSLDSSIKTAIFDGGIPDDHPIGKWVDSYEFEGMGEADDDLLFHGVGVTSAFLFGHIDPSKGLSRPFSDVDHYRILEDVPGSDPYELFEVLDRITSVLNSNDYDFINISLGPRLPIEDNDIHAWTAVLDDYLSNGKTLMTVAVGNDGEGDIELGLNRIQVPSDCVNALSIGACDNNGVGWNRALYSSVGPGRSPGLIKPDLVDFGGTTEKPFNILASNSSLQLAQVAGTSFSAPAVLRLGAGIKAHFGTSLNSLAIKTLLIHCSESSDHSIIETGWGRVARNIEDIVVCDDSIVRVVFQGKISASKFMRSPIPLPLNTLEGKVNIKATLCYATAVDPHHPDNYTRSGLEVVFRPHADKRNKPAAGKPLSLHAKSKSFFGKTKKNYQSEDELRRDAFKWENCVHSSNKFLGSSLKDPVFDIHYNARMEGRNNKSNIELSYALVITVEAPKVPDLYDQVVRRYATKLEQFKPVIEIPLKIK